MVPQSFFVTRTPTVLSDELKFKMILNWMLFNTIIYIKEDISTIYPLLTISTN